MRYTGTVQKGVIVAKGINYTDYIGENEIELTEEEYNTIPIPCRKVDGEFIPCELPKCEANTSAIPLSHDLSSYFEFIRWNQDKNMNREILDCAFGKGNEDMVVGIGNQMAMYAWYKGTDKGTSPFSELTLMHKLSNMSDVAFSEMVMNDYLKDLICSSDYVLEKAIHWQSGSHIFDQNDKTTVSTKTVKVIDKTLNSPFYFGYTTTEGTSTPDARSISISFNGVNIVPETSTIYGDSSYKWMLNWSDYGITEPGEYSLTIESTAVGVGNGNLFFSYDLIAKKE